MITFTGAIDQSRRKRRRCVARVSGSTGAIAAAAAAVSLSACALFVGTEPDYQLFSPDAGLDARAPSPDATIDRRDVRTDDAIEATSPQRDAVNVRSDAPSKDRDGGTGKDATTDVIDARAHVASVVTLATGQSQPRGIVTANDQLYWLNEGESVVRTMPLPVDGGAPQTPTAFLSSTPGTDLLTDGSHLYVLTGTNYLAVAGGCSGAVCVPFAASTAGFCMVNAHFVSTRMALDNVNLYLGGGTTILYGPLPGVIYDQAASLPGVPASITAMTSNGGTLFIAAGGQIYAQPIGTGSAVMFSVSTDAINDMLVDETAVYWITSTGNVLSQAVSAPGGTASVLASGQSQPTRMTSDSASLYWTNAGLGVGEGSVVTLPKVPVAIPAVPDVLAAGQDSPYGVWRDTNALYWTSSGAGTVNVISR
jgi:hypothetical protein